MVRDFAKKSWSVRCRRQPIAHFDFEKPAYQRGAPIVVKADGLALGRSVVVARTVDRRSKQLTICSWINSATAVRDLSRVPGRRGSPSLPLSMATSFTSCPARTISGPTMGIGTQYRWYGSLPTPVPLPQNVVDTAVDLVSSQSLV